MQWYSWKRQIGRLGSIGENIDILESLASPKNAQNAVKPAKVLFDLQATQLDLKLPAMVRVTCVDSPSYFIVQRAVDEANIKKV